MEEEHLHQPVVAAEHVHQEPRDVAAERLHNVAVVPERVHMEEEHLHQPAVAAEPVHEEHRVHMEEQLHNVAQGQAVSGLAAPSSSSSLLDHVSNLFSADRGHSEEHVHLERVHAEEHLHQEHVHH
jgi:hypothetical protein